MFLVEYSLSVPTKSINNQLTNIQTILLYYLEDLTSKKVSDQRSETSLRSQESANIIMFNDSNAISS